MDTRILLDYIERRPWLWGLVPVFVMIAGFQSTAGASGLLVPAFLYLAILPMSWELQNLGPIWIQRMLPVKQLILVRTAWWLLVVMPVVTIAISLLPAYFFGVITGSANLATNDLFRIITIGLLFTGSSFVLTALLTYWWRYKLLRVLALIGMALVAMGLMMEMVSGKYWDAMPIRLGLIGGAALLLIVSYIVAPQLLQVTGRKQDTQKPTHSGTPPLKSNRTSIISIMLESPTGRALVSGLWLLTGAICFYTFGIIRYGLSEFVNIQTNMPAMVAVTAILSIFLYSISSVHITSFRAMACLPMSRVRRTLTFFSLPIIAIAPLTLFTTITLMFMTTGSEGIIRSALVLLYGLMAVHAGLALQVRFGKILAIVVLIVITQVLIIGGMFRGKHVFSELSGLEAPVMLGVMLATGLWAHWTLNRYQKAYRHQLLPREPGTH